MCEYTKTFDLIKTIQCRAYHEGGVTVYQHEDRIHKQHDLSKKLKYHTNEQTKDYKELDKKVKEATKAIEKSALTFKMRGVEPPIINLLVDKHRENSDVLQGELLSATLYAVVDAEGAEDRRKFSVEDCKAIRDEIPLAAYAKVSEKATDLNMGAAIYDQTIEDRKSTRLNSSHVAI